MCKDLNSQKCKFNPLQRSKYRQTSIFSEKIVHKVSDSVLVVFTKCENAGIESFFIFLQKQMIEGLPVICEPFSTASAAGRETTPPMTVKGTVNDL